MVAAGVGSPAHRSVYPAFRLRVLFRFDDLHGHGFRRHVEIFHHRVGDILHQRLLLIGRPALDRVNDDFRHCLVPFTDTAREEARDRPFSIRKAIPKMALVTPGTIARIPAARNASAPIANSDLDGAKTPIRVGPPTKLSIRNPEADARNAGADFNSASSDFKALGAFFCNFVTPKRW